MLLISSGFNTNALDVFEMMIRIYFDYVADDNCICLHFFILNAFLIQCVDYSCFMHIEVAFVVFFMFRLFAYFALISAVLRNNKVNTGKIFRRCAR